MWAIACIIYPQLKARVFIQISSIKIPGVYFIWAFAQTEARVFIQVQWNLSIMVTVYTGHTVYNSHMEVSQMSLSI